jgi:serine protease Do/serine protease DegQ
MITKTRLFWATLFLALVSSGTLAALPTSVGGQAVTSLAPLVEAATPAVVNIRATQVRRNPFGRQGEIGGAGSGVIVDAENGYILTNHHVVGEADEIQVSLIDGRTLDAEIVGSDAGTDIALIKVEADELTEMPIGDSEDVRVGDFVIAIGNPYGLSHTVTSGIVSALGRTNISRDGFEDFIQTDASINPGNSGGALVNMNGELIGINSMIFSRSGGNIGIGFAVPTEIASSIMGQILDFGEIRRGLLGVNIQSIDREAAETLDIDVEGGALVTRVFPDSAAEKAGEIGRYRRHSLSQGQRISFNVGRAWSRRRPVIVRRRHPSRTCRREFCSRKHVERQRRRSHECRGRQSGGTARIAFRRRHYGCKPSARA